MTKVAEFDGHLNIAFACQFHCLYQYCSSRNFIWQIRDSKIQVLNCLLGPGTHVDCLVQSTTLDLLIRLTFFLRFSCLESKAFMHGILCRIPLSDTEITLLGSGNPSAFSIALNIFARDKFQLLLIASN